MADKDTGESFDLGAVSDEEARRWQDYAERWGTDQYDDGPWIWTALEYVVLAYIIGTAPLKVWALLVKVGLAD